MTLSSTTSKQTYAGDGTTTVFPVPFLFLDNAHIEAVLRDSGGTEIPWTENTQYTQTGAGVDSGGTLTVNTAPTDYTPQSGEALVIRRVVPATQETDYPEAGAFPAAAHETALDKLTMLVQQHAEQFARALLFPVSDSASLFGEIPSSSVRGGRFLAFDSAGNPIAAAGTSADLGPVSAFIDTLLDDTDAATARGTLGALGSGDDGTQLSGLLHQGWHTIWVPAAAMIARQTSGAAYGAVELSGNNVMLRTLDFDASADEFAQFTVAMPKSWNEGTVNAQFLWSHGATTTNFDVVWGIQGVAVSDDDAMDATFGTAVTASDSGGTTDDVYISTDTPALTIGGSPTEGDLVVFQVYRDANAVADTLAIDARLIGVRLFIDIVAGTDA